MVVAESRKAGFERCFRIAGDANKSPNDVRVELWDGGVKPNFMHLLASQSRVFRRTKAQLLTKVEFWSIDSLFGECRNSLSLSMPVSAYVASLHAAI